MLRSALLAFAILLITAAPSFGHGLAGSGSGPAKHSALSGNAVGQLPGTGQPEGMPGACTHMITPHCLGAIDQEEYQPCLPAEYSGRWQFHLRNPRLRGILPAADTPPPRA